MRVQDASSAAGRACREAKDVLVFLERLEEPSLLAKLGDEFMPAGLFLEMQLIMSLLEPEESSNFEVLFKLNDADNQGGLQRRKRMATSVQLMRTKFGCANLSGASLNDEKFVQDIFTILYRPLQVVPLLCIEITESVALHDLEHTSRFIDRLQALGAKVALDDFGEGYTSFTYIKSLSADALKIDGAFI